MSETIFRAGDQVFDYHYGWGIVVNSEAYGTFAVEVEFDQHNLSYTNEGCEFKRSKPSLSFTEYDPVNGGFSQERPRPEIEQGQLIYVSNGAGWDMRFFSHWGSDGKVRCFPNQEKHGRGVLWKKYSIENPL